jgi:hypothetical protein
MREAALSIIAGQHQATVQARVKVSAPPTLCRGIDPYFSDTM